MMVSFSVRRGALVSCTIMHFVYTENAAVLLPNPVVMHNSSLQ
jgi:hypothetical protein